MSLTDFQSKQGLENTHTLSTLVQQKLKDLGWTAAYLARQSNLSKTTISRIIRNSNDKGSSYLPTPSVVAALALAFGMDRNGWELLMNAAFPERVIWLSSLDSHANVMETNERLYDAGLPLLGYAKTE